MSDSAVPAGVQERTGPRSQRSRRSALALGWARQHVWSIAVGTSMFVWSAVLFSIARNSFLTFRVGRFDLGNMVQAVWSTAHGRPLDVTNGYTGEQMVRLGNHVDPILAALAPFWLVAPTPLTLIAVQVVAVALGALPLYWLGQRHLGSQRAAALLVFAYLAYPWIAWTAIDAFHPVTLAIPLFLFCVWALDADRLVVFSACAVLAATTGELMAVPIAALGIWYALGWGRRRIGALIAVAALAWVLAAFLVVVPHYSGGESAFYGAYREVGGSPTGILQTAVTDPLTIVSAATHRGDFLYVFLLAAPLGGLFVLAPGLAAVALPQLAANLLGGFAATTDPHAHYIAAIVPFLFAATCVGLGRWTREARFRGVFLVLTLSVAATAVVGPWTGSLSGSATWYRKTSPEFQDALRHAISLVPDDAPVSATNRAGVRLSARRYVYSVPVIRRATWIVLDSTDPWMPQAIGGYADRQRLRTFRSEVEHSASWRKVYERDGVLVFRKVRP